MDSKPYDVIIIGGGGAGLMLARELSHKKCRVLLLERKTDLLQLSFKTLGSFMDIEEFGLPQDVVAADIRKISLYSRNVKCSASVMGCVLDKTELHRHLIASIDNNYAAIQTGVRIKSCSTDQEGWITHVTDDKGNTYQASYYVDATGLEGVLSKAKGLQSKQHDVAVGVEYNVKYKGNSKEAHLYLGKHYEGGYGWLFPLRNHRAILGFGSFENMVINELKERLNNMFAIPHIANIVEKDNHVVEGGILPITPVKTKFVRHNLICVGDAVSQVNPIVGEGYKFIFRAAVMAANAIEKALSQQNPLLLHEYEQEWNKLYTDFYQNSKRMQRRLIKYSKSDMEVDIGMLFLKTKRNRTIEKLISGEFTRANAYLP